MVTGMRLVAVAAVANCCAAASYSNVEFDISAVRDTSASIVQLSEFRLYDTDGVEIAIASASNPDGDNPSGEGAEKAIDGSTSTKWLDFNEGDLVLALASPSEIGSYSWATANDEEGRDPVMWTLLGYDDDASTWTTLDDTYSSSSFSPTFSRYTWVGTFDIPPDPTSTPTSTPTPVPTSAPTSTPTSTPTRVPTSTPTASAPTSTPTQSPVPTPAPTSAAPSTTSPTLAPSTKSVRSDYEVCPAGHFLRSATASFEPTPVPTSAPPAGAAGCWCDDDEAYYGLGAETRVSLAQTYVAPRASLRFSFVFIACCACSSLFINRLSTESFWRPRPGAAGEIKMSRPRYFELPSVSAVREARLRLEHVFALGPPTSFGSAPPKIPASELFAAVSHTDAPSPRPTVSALPTISVLPTMSLLPTLFPTAPTPLPTPTPTTSRPTQTPTSCYCTGTVNLCTGEETQDDCEWWSVCTWTCSGNRRLAQPDIPTEAAPITRRQLLQTVAAPTAETAPTTRRQLQTTPAPTASSPGPTVTIAPTAAASEHSATCAPRAVTWATILFDLLDVDADGSVTLFEQATAGLNISGCVVAPTAIADATCVDLDLDRFLAAAGNGYADSCCLCEAGDACAGGRLALSDVCPLGEFSAVGYSECESTLCDAGCINAKTATCDARGRCSDYPGCLEGWYGESCANTFNATTTLILGWLTLLFSLPIFAATVHRGLFEHAQAIVHFLPRKLEAVISRALLSKGGGDDGGGDDKRRGQNSLSPMQLTSASARGVGPVGAPPSAEAVDEVISVVGQHAAVGGAAAVSATKAASGVALACGGGAVGAVVAVCAKLPELVGTVGLKVTRHLFALYLLVTDIEVPERAEEQLARIGGASRDLATAPSRPSGNILRGSAPVPNLLLPLKLPISVPSTLPPPSNVPPSAPTDSLYNFFGFIDLSSVWRAVWRVGDYFEDAFELLSEKVNIDVDCPGAYSAWYQLTNSALIFALLLLFQSDLLLYCRITILKFGRGRNAVVKYAVGNFSHFAYESALVLEQLAVASWSLRLYYYGWIRKHREEGIGGLDSVCNDESNGADATLFLVTNMVAWLMAPFQLYMLVNCFAKGVPHNGCYRGFYGSFPFGGVAFQKRGLQGAAKIVGLRDDGPWARAAERYHDKANSGFHRGLVACTRPVVRAADAYLKLGEAASTIPSLVKSMCGVWDKGHVVTMEVVADAAAFDDDEEDENAHFEDVLVARGQGTSLLWMMVPGCVALAKLSQLLAESPLRVTKQLPLKSQRWQRQFNVFWALVDWTLMILSATSVAGGYIKVYLSLVVAAAVPVTAVQLTEGILWDAGGVLYDGLTDGAVGDALASGAVDPAKVAAKAEAAARAAEEEEAEDGGGALKMLSAAARARRAASELKARLVTIVTRDGDGGEGDDDPDVRFEVI